MNLKDRIRAFIDSLYEGDAKTTDDIQNDRLKTLEDKVSFLEKHVQLKRPRTAKAPAQRR